MFLSISQDFYGRPFTRLHARSQIPACITHVRQSDCAADVTRLRCSDEVPGTFGDETYPRRQRDDPNLHEAFSLFPVNAAVGLHAWTVTTGAGLWMSGTGTGAEVQVQ